MRIDWQDLEGNWILMPNDPIAIVHFLGGAFIGSAPHVAYRYLLEQLAHQGYAIMATPFSNINTLDHQAVAEQVVEIFYRGLAVLKRSYFRTQPSLPIYGLGHSMGCKLHLLIGSLYEIRRAGNVFMAFNNFPIRRSIPLADQFLSLSPVLEEIEFTPSPEELNRMIEQAYQVERNLLIKFKMDDLDQTRFLTDVLDRRFSVGMTTVEILRGNHLTPMGQNVTWSPGTAYSPLDAIGQLFRQELYRDLQQLSQTILFWLENPSIPV